MTINTIVLNHQTQVHGNLEGLLVEEETREEVSQEDKAHCLEIPNSTQGDHPKLIVGDVEDHIFSVIVQKSRQM